MRLFLIALVLGFGALHSWPAASQSGNLAIRGAIEKVDGGLLVLQGQAAGISSVSMDSDTAIFIRQPSSLSAIKVGDYVASTAVKGDDGRLRSKELRILPEALRGIGEGQRPMNAPDTVMTNASVAEVVAIPEGQVLTVKYKDGTAELIVSPQVPVTAVVPSDASVLKPGMRVVIFVEKNPDGTARAKRIMVAD